MACVFAQTTGLPRRGVGGRLGDQQAGDAGVVARCLARGIDVEDDGEVGLRERLAERRGLALRAAEEVRLEQRDDPLRALRRPSIVARTSVGWWA